MAITAESTSSRILVHINDNRGPFILQRAKSGNRTWLTLTENGFAIIPESPEEPIEPLPVDAGDFVDSFDLTDELYEYRYIPVSIEEPKDKDWVFTQWVKFGSPDRIGYTFGNYKAPEGSWGAIATPDDMRFTYLWGTDLKSTNGDYFSDEQLAFFIKEATYYAERVLNITIERKRFATCPDERNLIQGSDYDEEEDTIDFSYRKIQRYGMIQTHHRPIINVSKCELINRGNNNHDLMDSIIVDKKKGFIKFFDRPFMPNDTMRGISKAIGRYGDETFQRHLFYVIDYEAGFKTSDFVPPDLRQAIMKIAAVSLLNVIGDGLMSGFSSSSLSMDGISESFSSTMSATSAYYGARIAEYKKDIEDYLKRNKYRFGHLPINSL